MCKDQLDAFSQFRLDAHSAQKKLKNFIKDIKTSTNDDEKVSPYKISYLSANLRIHCFTFYILLCWSWIYTSLWHLIIMKFICEDNQRVSNGFVVVVVILVFIRNSWLLSKYGNMILLITNVYEWKTYNIVNMDGLLYMGGI